MGRVLSKKLHVPAEALLRVVGMILDWLVVLREFPVGVLRCLILGTMGIPQELRELLTREVLESASPPLALVYLVSPGTLLSHCVYWAQTFLRTYEFRGFVSLLGESGCFLGS